MKSISIFKSLSPTSSSPSSTLINMKYDAQYISEVRKIISGILDKTKHEKIEPETEPETRPEPESELVTRPEPESELVTRPEPEPRPKLRLEPILGPGIDQIKSKNRGTGAGGANTNKNGKKFEELICNEPRLISQGFTRKTISTSKTGKIQFDYALSKTFENKTIYFVRQGNLKKFMIQQEYNDNIFRNPDEAYIITFPNSNIIYVKIVEMKEQSVDGSIIDKILAGPCYKDEYDILLNNPEFKKNEKYEFRVEYALVLCPFLKEKWNSNVTKFRIWNINARKNNISVFFGNDTDYYEKLDAWIYGDSTDK